MQGWAREVCLDCSAREAEICYGIPENSCGQQTTLVRSIDKWMSHIGTMLDRK